MTLDTTKLPLHVYYTFDLTNHTHTQDSSDISLFETCLKVFLSVHAKQYTLKTYCKIEQQTDRVNSDKVLRGIRQFRNMFCNLKLKTTDATWFVYITNGSVRNIRDDVFLVLLNQEPFDTRCLYAINEYIIDIPRQSDRVTKRHALQTFNRVLRDLFTGKNVFDYKHV